ncbi:intronic ORF at intron 4 of cox1 protein [Jimgerdemannia flammicorona]|uniref:Intronic ORF at intron 4 of cox1 protein n=1 Tax=Jimgerdemannia flammicorona TaxID=994334 RepID=A0A433PLL6_9FUNG|nr:intronic ORF at intron 4 of cox1 protein [Jimgerdemannia flammicorona]
MQQTMPHWNARLALSGLALREAPWGLGFKQSMVHFPFFWHVWDLLSHYCSAMPHGTIAILRGIKYFGVEFFTRALPCFTELFHLFYVNGLAFWIMGDGAIRNMGLILCTDSYTIPDIVRLMNVLMIKFDLKCTGQNDTPSQRRIYIPKDSMEKLRALVMPHMHHSTPGFLFFAGKLRLPAKTGAQSLHGGG